MKAVWNDTVIAQSEATRVVEGNHYFPPESLIREHFRASEKRTVCPWQGEASYYHIVVGESVNQDAAWYYPEPKEAAREIQNHVAFWKGVEVA